MIQNNKNVLGVILAGGLSRRMKGGNKFFKKINGKFLIEHVIHNASDQVSRLIINTKSDRWFSLNYLGINFKNISCIQNSMLF